MSSWTLLRLWPSFLYFPLSRHQSLALDAYSVVSACPVSKGTPTPPSLTSVAPTGLGQQPSFRRQLPSGLANVSNPGLQAPLWRFLGLSCVQIIGMGGGSAFLLGGGVSGSSQQVSEEGACQPGFTCTPKTE